MDSNISRRTLLASSAVVAASQLQTKADAQTPSQKQESKDGYAYEVSYTDAEWKARLSPEEFRILRMGGTEKRKSSPLWEESREGSYQCKGCDLGVYDSQYKIILNKGWTFFEHCEPNTVLTKIDFITSYGGSEKKTTATEAHCRRCGSHLGHILYISRKILHCINGTSLVFTPSV